MTALFNRLKETNAKEWASYVDHEFIRQLAAGTLPKKAFQTYLIQDYLFLIQFARAKALAVYKSQNLKDMHAAEQGLAGILSEMELHVRLCGEWGLSEAELEATPEHPTTIAYTRYVLDCGVSGDLIDLLVALSPCVIGYAEIARRIRPEVESISGHPYAEWVSEYAGDAYQTIARDTENHLDELAKKYVTEQRFADLGRIFATAARLEADFWQIGLRASQ
ncbi:thiaminase II [Microvirga sp. W0021]|uniref:Aminopyrimidine aminohydrolase n=1 Tax=Hohaiivirga grylli TaxID=3133970 RepID=A0ABV0BJU9_9HYPH